MKRISDSYRTEYMIHSKKNDNRGAAMIVAIIVVAILMVFSFSLLLVSYTLYASQSKKVASKKCSEAANSLSLAMETELCDKDAISNSDFWIYLRFHMLQSDWTFYEPGLGDDAHNKEAVKSFTLNVNPKYIPDDPSDPTGKTKLSTIDGFPGSVKFKVYWMMPEELYANNDTDTLMGILSGIDLTEYRNRSKDEYKTEDYKKIRLFVEITCESASQSYTVKNEYYLSAQDYTDAQEREKNLLREYKKSNVYNENNSCSIKDDERWEWTFVERE